MRFAVDEAVRRRAKGAHELFMINLGLFHLLLGPAALFLGIGLKGLLLPLTFSASMMLYMLLRCQRSQDGTEHWFTALHWRLAVRRNRWLLLGYTLTGTILLGGWLLTLGVDRESTRHILVTVITRIAVMPTIILVLVCFVMENSALNMALGGELPDTLLKRFPAPADATPISE